MCRIASRTLRREPLLAASVLAVWSCLGPGPSAAQTPRLPERRTFTLAIAEAVTITAGETFTKSFPVTCDPGPAIARLSLSGAPAGTVGTFDPAEVRTDGTSTLTLPTTFRTPSGQYTLKVTATPVRGICSTNSFTIPLSVKRPVQLEVTPERDAVGPGGKVDFKVAIRRPSGFRGPVRLAVAGLPKSIESTFQPNDTGLDRATLTLTAKPDARDCRPPSGCTFTVSGTARAEVEPDTATVALAPRVTLTPERPTVTSSLGGSATFRFAVNRFGYDGPVKLDLPLPAGLDADVTITPSAFTQGNDFTAVVGPVRSARRSSFTLRATPVLPSEVKGARVEGADVTLALDPGVSFTAVPELQTLPASGGTTAYQLIFSRNGFSGDIQLDTVLGLPPGATFRAVPAGGVNPRQVEITVPASAPGDLYPLTILCSYLVGDLSVSIPDSVLLMVGPGAVEVVVKEDPVLPIEDGSSRPYGILVRRIKGYNGRVRLKVDPAVTLPDEPPAPPASLNVTATLNPPVVLEPDQFETSLTIQVPTGTPQGGPFAIQVGGEALDAAGTVDPKVPVTPDVARFEIRPGTRPSIQLDANPPRLELFEGDVKTSLIRIIRINGAAGTVDLELPLIPPVQPNEVVYSLGPVVNDQALLTVEGRVFNFFRPVRLDITGQVVGNPAIPVLPTAVTFNLLQPPLPPPLAQLTVAPAALTFRATQGGSAPPAQTVAIGSTGPALDWTASPDVPWLRVAPASGTTPGAASVTVNPAGLAPGNGTGRIRLAAPGSPAIDLTVSLLIEPRTPTPTITAFSPASGPAGLAVSVTGTNFDSEGTVRFNGVAASFSSPSSTRIDAIVPAGATTGRISFVGIGGTAVSATDFVVTTPAPTLATFSPSSGRPGDQVTLTGTNFSGVTQVTFGGVSASSFTIASPSLLRVLVPPGAVTGPLRLLSPGGTATSAGSFTVTTGTLPTITGFSPTSGPAGTAVVITGTNFEGDAIVRFNGVEAGFSSPGSTRIDAVVPAGATSGPITVVTSTGSVTSAGSFTVTGGAALRREP